MKAFKGKFGYEPTSIPISGGSYRHFGALDAVVFFVNKDNPIEKLTLKQVDGIFSATRKRGGKDIKTWGDLGLKGEWAAKPISLYPLDFGTAIKGLLAVPWPAKKKRRSKP